MGARRRYLPAILLLAAAAVFFALGVFRGEVDTVLRKASTICLECIGIG
jgi:hypothetical protein